MNLGPLAQLSFVIIAYLIAAFAAGAALYCVIQLASRILGGNRAIASQGFWFPLKLGPYFLAALIGNTLFCEYVRDVDPPLTDSWSFPIGDKVMMGAIDSTDKWTIWPNRDGGEGILSGIVLFKMNDEAVYGKVDDDSYFIFWLESTNRLVRLAELDFEAEIAKNGWARDKLKKPIDYYNDRRATGDLISLMAILIYPFFRLYRLLKSFFSSTGTNSREHFDQAT